MNGEVPALCVRILSETIANAPLLHTQSNRPAHTNNDDEDGESAAQPYSVMVMRAAHSWMHAASPRTGHALHRSPSVPKYSFGQSKRMKAEWFTIDDDPPATTLTL
jgi:hypothetical protein